MAIYLLDSVIRPFNNRVQNNNQKKKTKNRKTIAKQTKQHLTTGNRRKRNDYFARSLWTHKTEWANLQFFVSD